MVVLIRWRIYCITEGIWTYGWISEDEGTPGSCFTNNTHTVNSSSQHVVETTHETVVRIDQETIPTGGNFTSEGYCMDILANQTNTLAVSWPFPITTSAVHVQSMVENDGDTLDAIVNPQTNVGTITSGYGVGVTTLDVDVSVIGAIQLGFEVYINSESLGRCISIDTVNLNITVEKATTVTHAVDSPVYIELKIIRNFQLGTNSGNDLGTSNMGGQYLQAGTITHVIYTNTSNDVKKFRFLVEYLF